MDVATPGAELQLVCRPRRNNKSLMFDYSLLNLLDRDVFVQDALPSVDRFSRAVSANSMAATIIQGADGDAIVGKYMPPTPGGARPAVPVNPLAYRLTRGETMERRLEVREPLAETSPYLPDQLLRQYEEVEIPAVTFTIAYWISGGSGFVPLPCPYANEFFSMVLRGGVAGGTRLVLRRFATRGLRLFRRKDEFPRTPPSEGA